MLRLVGFNLTPRYERLRSRTTWTPTLTTTHERTVFGFAGSF